MLVELDPREVDWLLKRALDARFESDHRPHSPEVDETYNLFLDGIIEKINRAIDGLSPPESQPLKKSSANSSITIDHTGRLSK